MTNRLKMTQAIAGLPPDVTPANVDTASADPRFTLGAVYWKDGKAYRYVQFLDAVAYIAGHVLTWANATGTAVTNDRAGGSAVGSTQAVGVATRVHTENHYGFMQVSGVNADVQTDTGVSAGESLVAHTVDGQSDTMAAGEEHLVFATALADDATNTVTANLRGLL